MAQPSSWKDPPPFHEPEMRSGAPRFTGAVRTLVLLNVGVYLVQFLLWFFSRMSGTEVESLLFGHLKLSPDDWRAFLWGLPLWQLGTYGFLHAVTDPLHIAFNMLILFFFGSMLEGIVGSRRLVVTYLAAMVAGAVLFLATGIVQGAVTGSPQIPAVGASGACFGVLIAMAVLRPHATVLFLFIPVTLRVLALILVAFDLLGLMITLGSGATDGVAHLIHLGGALYGFAAVKTGLIWFDPVEFRRRRQAVKAVERAATDDQRMDEILAKIHSQGMNALTRGEREFLKRMSSRR